MPIEIYLPEWISAHPDLSVDELAQVVRLAKLSEEKIQRKLIEDPISYEAISWDEQMFSRMGKSINYLRSIM